MPATAKSCSAPEFNSYELAECGPLPEAETKELGPAKCREKRKVLILDDDRELLDAYKKILGGLPSRPQVRVASSATQALAMLEAEPFELFITDLRMPKIDGFQVLLSAQRRSPELKTVVMTGDASDQYRTRAYESGIDLFIQKPTTAAEIRMFGECVEALLLKGKKDRGFRGIQRKSLMDLVQFECLSQNSSTLRITSGSLVGRVWILNGNVIDAEANGLRGEEAFRYIFGWKTGNFETMPGDPQREQTIFTSHESLLLSSAQMLDEVEAEKDRNRQVRDREFKVLATVHGVQSLLLIREDNETCDLWGFERPEGFAAWTRRVLRDFQGLGEMLKTGPLSAVQAAGVARGLVVLTDGQRQLLAGMDGNMTMKSIRKAGRELARHLGEGLQAARNGPGNTIALLREPAGSARHPCGSFTVSTLGKVSVSAMPPTFPRVFMEVIGKVIITAFNSARELDNPLTEFAADFATVEIRAQDAGGGAIVFIAPREY